MRAYFTLLILLALTPAAAHEPLGQGEAQISVGPVSEEALPDLAADRLGNTWVLWKGPSNDTTNAIFLQRYNPSGQPSGPQQLLPQTGARPFAARIGFDDAGHATVIWHDREHMRLAGQCFDAEGRALGDVFTIAMITQLPSSVAPFSPSRAALAVAPAGHFVVAWADPATGVLHARRMNADGSPLSGVLTVNQTAGVAQTTAIAVRSNGDFAVSWIDAFPIGPVTVHTFIRFFDAQGVATSEALGYGLARGRHTPHSVLTAADGEVVMAYEDYGTIDAQRFSWTGTPLGPPITVSTTEDFQDHSPTIVQATTGALLVVWVRERFPASQLRNRLWGRWLEADGTPRGAAFWLSPGLASALTLTAATADGQGNVIVAHHNLPGETFDVGHVFARRLAPDARTGTVQWHAAASERFEGDTQAAFTAVRSGGSEGSVYVNYRIAGGSATPGADFLGERGNVIFTDGETGAKTVAVTLRDDQVTEADETFAITLSNPSSGAALVAPATTTATLIDNDFTPPGVQPIYALPPFQLNPPSPDVHLDPAAATHASGIRAVAWVQGDAFTGVHTVYARRFDRQGRPLGDPIPLGEAEIGLEESADRPAVAFDVEGGFLVVWGAGRLQGRYVDAAGVPANAAFGIRTTGCAPVSLSCPSFPYDPSVVAVSADTFAVVWNDPPFLDLLPSSVRFVIIDRHGGRQSEGFAGLGASEGRVAAYQDGSFIIAWRLLETAALSAVRFDATGRFLDLPMHLPAGSARPAVATGPGARAFVAYQQPEIDDEIYGVFIDGNTVGAPFRISTAPGLQQQGLAVGMDGEGNAVVTWESQGREGSGTGLYARRFRANGQAVGNDVRLMATQRGDQRNPVLSAGPRGDVLAAWAGETPSGERDILGRLLPIGRCDDERRTLCLGGGRFLLEVVYEDFLGRRGPGMPVGLSANTGAFYFFDENNLELVVKVLDGNANNGHYWVFYGALSNIAFDLTVTDLETGAVARYHNPLGTFASVGDTEALPALGAPLASAASPTAERPANSGALISDPTHPSGGSCVPTATTLCLGDGRFAVTTTWLHPIFVGFSGAGQALPQNNGTGTFWFFDEDNIELIVKVLDGRENNDHYWFFYGALSNVDFTVTVTDTVTGVSKTYDNPGGTFASVGDTTAFPAAGH